MQSRKEKDHAEQAEWRRWNVTRRRSSLQPAGKLEAASLRFLLALPKTQDICICHPRRSRKREEFCLASPQKDKVKKGKLKVSVTVTCMSRSHIEAFCFWPALWMFIGERGALVWWPFGFWDERTCVCDVSICVCTVTRKKNLSNIIISVVYICTRRGIQQDDGAEDKANKDRFGGVGKSNKHRLRRW